MKNCKTRKETLPKDYSLFEAPFSILSDLVETLDYSFSGKCVSQFTQLLAKNESNRKVFFTNHLFFLYTSKNTFKACKNCKSY